jgi:hypothetical protein
MCEVPILSCASTTYTSGSSSGPADHHRGKLPLTYTCSPLRLLQILSHVSNNAPSSIGRQDREKAHSESDFAPPIFPFFHNSQIPIGTYLLTTTSTSILQASLHHPTCSNGSSEFHLSHAPSPKTSPLETKTRPLRPPKTRPKANLHLRLRGPVPGRCVSETSRVPEIDSYLPPSLA